MIAAAAPASAPRPPVVVKHTPQPQPPSAGSAAPINPYDESTQPPQIADPFAKPNPYGR
jgi:hypothetical protein